MTKKNKEAEKPSTTTSFEGENGKCGLASSNGTILVPAEYDDILYWKDDCFSTYPVGVMNNNGLWGIVKPDGNGTIISDCQWKDIEVLFISDCFMVQSPKNEKWGVINGSGEIIVPVEMDNICNYCCDDLITFDKDGKVGIHILDTNIFMLGVFDNLCSYALGEYLYVEKDGRNGRVTVDGQFVADEDYDKMDEDQQDELEFIFCND